MTRTYPRPLGLMAVLLCLVGTSCSPGEPPAPEEETYAGPFTRTEARALREAWDYVDGWFGGDRMRFGHLNVDRLVPTVALRGGGRVRALPEAPRPEVSEHIVKGEAAAAHAGLFTTLRDLGRLGMFVLEQDAFQRKLVDDARPHLFSDSWGGAYETAADRPTHAAWQSDVVFADGDFGKGGWGGQFLYVSPGRDLVIAWFRTFGEDLVDPDLQSVARQLATVHGLW